MVGFEEAVVIAGEYYRIRGAGDVKIGTVYETDDQWILFRDPGDIIETGAFVIHVNKEDGKAELEGYPTREMHKILQTARKVQ